MGVSGATLIGMCWDMGYQSVFLTCIFTFLFCLVLLFAVCHLFLVCSLQSESRTQSTTELHHNYIAVETVAYRTPSPHLLSISAELLLQEKSILPPPCRSRHDNSKLVGMFVSPQCRRVSACVCVAPAVATLGLFRHLVTNIEV